MRRAIPATRRPPREENGPRRCRMALDGAAGIERVEKVRQVQVLAHHVQIRVTCRMVRDRQKERLVPHALPKKPVGAGGPVQEMPWPAARHLRRVDRIGRERRRIGIPHRVVEGGSGQPPTLFGSGKIQPVRPGGHEIAHPADVLLADRGAVSPFRKPPVRGGSL